MKLEYNDNETINITGITEPQAHDMLEALTANIKTLKNDLAEYEHEGGKDLIESTQQRISELKDLKGELSKKFFIIQRVKKDGYTEEEACNLLNKNK